MLIRKLLVALLTLAVVSALLPPDADARGRRGGGGYRRSHSSYSYSSYTPRVTKKRSYKKARKSNGYRTAAYAAAGTAAGAVAAGSAYAAANAQNTEKLIVVNAPAFLRTKRDSKSPLIEELNNGRALVSLGRVGDYYKARNARGKIGYISSRNVVVR